MGYAASASSSFTGKNTAAAREITTVSKIVFIPGDIAEKTETLENIKLKAIDTVIIRAIILLFLAI